MSRVLDIPKSMSEYLLKGWILTNEPCPVCSFPRMRSPHHSGESKLICVNCDGNASASSNTDQPSRDVSDSISSISEPRSGSSTPPTEVSPPATPPFVLPPPSEEMLRRRAQSDRASSEIGNRMLRGWTMLADECLNATCYGIPLVRSPGANPIKECVICGSHYDPNSTSTTLLAPTPPMQATSSGIENAQKGKQAISNTRGLKLSRSRSRSNLHPTSPVKVALTTSSPSKESMSQKVTRSSDVSLNQLHDQLEQSRAILSGLLEKANGTKNAREIGEVAESISKVALAMKTLSSLNE